MIPQNDVQLIVEEFGEKKQSYDLSIIVPVYNVEAYVGQCLSSVLTQHGLDIQLIIINDGSTDNSLEVINSFINQNIDLISGILISQKNQGPSVARNQGIQCATGKFIALMDSDDFVEPQAYSEAVQFAETFKCEIILCRALAFDDQTLAISPFNDADIWEQIMQGRKCLAKLNYQSTPQLFALEPSSCVRIINREFARQINLTYPPGMRFEDVYPHFMMIERAKSIGLLDIVLYYYRINHPGKITEARDKRRLDIVRAVSSIAEDERLCHLTSREGIFIILELIKISYWCIRQALGSDREELLDGLSKEYNKLPKEWLKGFQKSSSFGFWYRYLVNLLERKQNKILFRVAVAAPNRFSVALFLLRQKEFRLLIKLTRDVLSKRQISISRFG